MSLTVLAYNLKRVLNIMSFAELMKAAQQFALFHPMHRASTKTFGELLNAKKRLLNVKKQLLMKKKHVLFVKEQMKNTKSSG